MAKIRMSRARGGTCTGTIAIGAPDVHSVVTIAARGASRAEALHKASLVAEQIANDPIMMEVLPERSLAAIAAVKALSAAALQGPDALDEAWAELRGPGRDRLARVLALESRAEAACDDVGFLPFAALAAKYGPGIAKAAYGKVSSAVKARRERKRKAAAAARTRAALQARAAREAPPPEAPADEAPADEAPADDVSYYDGEG